MQFFINMLKRLNTCIIKMFSPKFDTIIDNYFPVLYIIIYYKLKHTFKLFKFQKPIGMQIF